jgi:uncharacterized protein YqeY
MGDEMNEPTTPDEDEAFNELERMAKQRREAVKAQFANWRESASDYERGVIDGMQKQMQSDVTKILMDGGIRGIRNATIEEIAQHIEKLTGFGQDTISSFAIYIRGMKK